MSSFYDLASSRRSIRKFEEQDVPADVIDYIIRTAVTAPSGCNSQCWRFIAIQERKTIDMMKIAVEQRINQILHSKKDSLKEEYLSSKAKMATFFAKAPVVIAVFMTSTKYYDPTFISILKEQGYDDEGIMEMFAHYDLLSVGAAIQNLLLAVHEQGYGACWMNEPIIAADDICQIINVPHEEKLISLIPIGIPKYTPREKKMKDMAEVFQTI